MFVIFGNECVMYIMRAEWARHRLTYIAWPARSGIWQDKYNDAVETYMALAREIARFEPVRLLVPPADHQSIVNRLDVQEPNVTVIPVQIDDGWVRDSGPVYVSDDNSNAQKILKWKFNAWGGKYTPFHNDARLPDYISLLDNMDLIDAPLYFEGGAFSVDGEGTLLTTESVVLNNNRNPGLDKVEAEVYFQDLLGVTKVIWLPQGLCDDETDGHSDNVAAFIQPGMIAALCSDDTTDPNYEILQENLAILNRETDARGRSLQVVPINQPLPMYAGERRLAASYINFYFVNDALLFPIFGQKNDIAAVDVIKRALPGRKIVPFDASNLVVGGGGIHCVTQQWPV